MSSQTTLHARFGGVVPEVAGRAHVDLLTPVVAEAMDIADATPGDLDAVAATMGPGLIGSLLVGVSAAKAYALAWGVPFIGVNHLEGHLHAAFLEDPDLALPAVVLVVSGGHTMLIHMREPGRYRLLGQTIDDAAGEAFDKVARFLGLGYPGGPAIEKAAAEGDPRAIAFPRGLRHDGYDFSFSGLKTVGDHLRPQAPGGGDGGRGRLVPGGGGRRPGGKDHAGRRVTSMPGRSASVVGWPPTPPCGSGSSAPLRRTGGRPSSPAGPCAPTTPPWSGPRPGTACASTVRPPSTPPPTPTCGFPLEAMIARTC